MHLVRAMCPCGYTSSKARSGYHHFQWWFPVFHRADGIVVDASCTLPEQDQDWICLTTLDRFVADPSDTRPADQQLKDRKHAILAEFMHQQTSLFREQFANDGDRVFDPDSSTTWECPKCKTKRLSVISVEVIAMCKPECGHEYAWADSEIRGCPKCNYRPHAFRTDLEPGFDGLPRTICSCRCSSSTESVSHNDGYCPKCGQLPTRYQIGTESICGIHHLLMQPYCVPSNFLFIHYEAMGASDPFPNAKFWGDAKVHDAGHDGAFCAECEKEHRVWLKQQDE